MSSFNYQVDQQYMYLERRNYSGPVIYSGRINLIDDSSKQQLTLSITNKETCEVWSSSFNGILENDEDEVKYGRVTYKNPGNHSLKEIFDFFSEYFNDDRYGYQFWFYESNSKIRIALSNYSTRMFCLTLNKDEVETTEKLKFRKAHDKIKNLLELKIDNLKEKNNNLKEEINNLKDEISKLKEN